MNLPKRLQRGPATRNSPDDLIEVRTLVPRSELVHVDAAPELLSQLNTDHVGMNRRGFLDALPEFAAAGHTVIKRGKLRLVDRAAFVAWLRAQSPAAPVQTSKSKAANDGAGFLEELGLRVVGGRGQR